MPVFREVLKKRTQNGELKAMEAIFWRVIPESVTKKGEGIILAVLIDGRYCKNLFIQDKNDRVKIVRSMKKKSLLIACTVLLVTVVVGALFWFSSRDAYGSSYLEEQRKLWNERRALFPAAWRSKGVTPNPNDFSLLVDIVPYTEEQLKELIDKRMGRDKQLRQEQIALRDREKPSFPSDDLGKREFLPIPVSQISAKDCLARARAGDGAACLMMAMHVGLKQASLHLSWREEKDVNFWLSQAEEHGRPEARFLKNFLQLSQKNAREHVKPLGWGGVSVSSSSCPDCSRLSGYGDFLKCMEAGDSLPYSLWEKMKFRYRLPDKELNILRDALRKKIKNGDVHAMEEWVTFYNETTVEYRSIIYDISSDMGKETWENIIYHLPQAYRDKSRLLLRRCGLMNAEDTDAMREFREVVEYAHLTARQGSLVGMAHWLRYGLFSLDHFSKEDWEDVFHYYRILVEQGYEHYLDTCWINPMMTRVDHEILDCCFGGKQVNEYVTSKAQSLTNRHRNFDADSTEGKDPDEVARDLDEAMATTGGDDVLKYTILESFIEKKLNPEIVAIYLDKVKSMAAEGDPLALCALGYLYEAGEYMEPNIAEAWKCYNETLKRISPSNTMIIICRNPLNMDETLDCRIQDAARMGLLRLLCLHQEFPGRDPKLVPSLLRDLEQLKEASCPSDVDFLFGRVYENGIGVLVDKEKALEYYDKGQGNSTGCEEGWKRLQKSVHSGKS